MRIAIGLLFLGTALGGCQYLGNPAWGPDAGNPNHFAYAGAPGSVYDVAANPPSDIGRVSYNAYAPLTNNLPADAALPPPTAATGPVNMGPVPSGNPALRNPSNPAMMNPAMGNLPPANPTIGGPGANPPAP